MADELDPLRDIFHLSASEKKAIDAASKIIGAVSSVWAIAGTVKSVLTDLGVLSEADVVQEMRNAIEQLWLRFESALSAVDRESAMRDIAEQLSYSREALQTLTQFAPERPTESGPEGWESQRALILAQTARVELALGDSAYWNRAFFSSLLYAKWPARWLHPKPVVTNGLVFDYRLALPAYMEAIAIRVTVLAAAVENHTEVARDELKRIANNLEGYFKKIRAGIVAVHAKPANTTDHVTSVGFPLSYYGVPDWIEGGALVGAVEIYSAFAQAGPWPYEFPVVGHTGSEHLWVEFLARYTVRDYVRWKQVFNGVGLGPVARTIVNLKRMAGIEPATVDGTLGDYSVRELAEALWKSPQVGQLGLYRVFEDDPGTFARGNLPSPISLKHILRVLQTYRDQPYTSLREALAQ